MRSSLKYGRASFSTGARLTLEPLLLFHRSHAGGTHAHGVRAAEKTELGSRNAFEREACPQLFPGANLPTGGAAAWHTSLILRDLPLKQRFNVVDTASIPTSTPFRKPIRARAEEKCPHVWQLIGRELDVPDPRGDFWAGAETRLNTPALHITV